MSPDLVLGLLGCLLVFAAGWVVGAVSAFWAASIAAAWVWSERE